MAYVLKTKSYFCTFLGDLRSEVQVPNKNCTADQICYTKKNLHWNGSGCCGVTEVEEEERDFKEGNDNSF